MTRRRPVPFDIGPVHFTGIGGAGMSGYAEIMLRLGYQVQGSDARRSPATERLEALGAKVFIGHEAAQVEGASAVVYSTAIKPDNPELAAARERRIPLVPRAEMMAELVRLKFSVAVAGSHGKTTTTSLVAALLEAGGLDPTVMNGGIINAYGANAKMGEGDWMAVEADESDGTFLVLKPTVAVVTNIDPEHLDYWRDFEGLKAAFLNFVESIPFYGFAVVCLDHPEVQAMAAKVENRRVVTYGTNPQAEVRALDIAIGPEGASFDVVIEPADREPHRIAGLRIPLAGEHNVLNALAGIAVARELGVTDEAIRKGLADFGGVRRRFTTTGVVGGVRIVDDYGHHPVEIAAVLKAARAMTTGRVIAVFQPHRFSRVADLFQGFCSCFNDADTVIVADIYPAGEAPIEGIDRDALVEGLRRAGHRHVRPLEGPAELAAIVAEEAHPGDFVICLGAGDVTAWAHALPGALEGLAAA
jgi:UDP-N-acetylmuramate--alanine ligase